MSNKILPYHTIPSNSMFVHTAGVSKYYVTLLNRANSVLRWTYLGNAAAV